ncbi:hypothetical protein O9992_02130 [Vibrio lentus]|nr:hypothetical protein [Vibrio lentus]
MNFDVQAERLIQSDTGSRIIYLPAPAYNKKMALMAKAQDRIAAQRSF